jgi:type I restriction enzyme R subunit
VEALVAEDQLENEALDWLVNVGYTHRHGSGIAPDSAAPERCD